MYCVTGYSRNKLCASILVNARILSEFLEDDLCIVMRNIDEAVVVPYGFYLDTESEHKKFIGELYYDLSDRDFLTDAVYRYSRADGSFKKLQEEA